MSTKRTQKRKKKVAQQKLKRQVAVRETNRQDKLYFLLGEAQWFLSKGEHDKALRFTKKALTLFPHDFEAINTLGRIGQELKDESIELKALTLLHQSDQLRDQIRIHFCYLLVHNQKLEQAMTVLEETIALLPQMEIQAPKQTGKRLKKMLEYVKDELKRQEAIQAFNELRQKTNQIKISQKLKPVTLQATIETPDKAKKSEKPLDALPQIKTTLELDESAFNELLSRGQYNRIELFDLILSAYKLRFQDSFEQLICLPYLSNVRSLWYQEETARKILKSFRGRALLADEVGLGKTIEAGMVLSEYISRRMIKSVLILTPTPLVTQWRDELTTKFNLSFVSTDDENFKLGKNDFWQSPFILASINIAKNKKNFDQVTNREYDLVIVDEAHHLKNRNTLNWKLVNQLKKRFLLLLTATPVENNLLELYNLVTLLKPGQLGTASDFKKEFMTRGDPTDPQNRTKLRDLLNQVMIRNTRAVAKIDIPPRFAKTFRVAPTKSEIALYERIIDLSSKISQHCGNKFHQLFKTLVEEAGSSPAAVKATLSNLSENHFLYEGFYDEVQAIKTLCKTVLDTNKNNMLLKIIKQNNKKKLVFVKYRATLDHLIDFLEWNRIGHALFHGGLTNTQKDDAIDKFKEDKHTQILLSTEIGGEGRNIQFCDHMINYDLPWNPMKIEQRIGRIHRLGQENEVHIFNLCAMHSIEDYILDILDKKINMFEMVIGEIDMILGRACQETDFGTMAYDIYMNANSEEERQIAFKKFATQLKRAKTGYQKTKELDGKLFGEDYEL